MELLAECGDAFSNLGRGNDNNKKLKYIIFKLREVKENDVTITKIGVDSQVSFADIDMLQNKDASENKGPYERNSVAYQSFIDKLPAQECLWGLFLFEYEKPDGIWGDKIIFISWYVSRSLFVASLLRMRSTFYRRPRADCVC